MTDASPRHWIWTVLIGTSSFLFITVVGLLIGAVFTPFLDPVKLWSVRQIYPSYHEFKASDLIQCQEGAIAPLLRQAILDDDLREAQSLEERFAERAYLCANVDWPMHSPIEQLRRLATEFEACFSYVARALPAFGTGEFEPMFSARLDQPNLCIVRLDKPDGVWRVVRDDLAGRVFCLPETFVGTAQTSAIEGLRRCTLPELERLGFPAHVLGKLAQ
jgi:hypothetical protein